jgi:hypothetical protein
VANSFDRRLLAEILRVCPKRRLPMAIDHDIGGAAETYIGSAR